MTTKNKNKDCRYGSKTTINRGYKDIETIWCAKYWRACCEVARCLHYLQEDK